MRRIADDAFVITHQPFFSSNTLAVRMPDGTVVLCSSPFETQATRTLVRWIRSTFRPPRIVAINTHFHFDGTGGNEAYRELGVETWGTTHTRDLLLAKGAKMQRELGEELEGEQRARVLVMRIVEAEHTFREERGLVLPFGSAEVRVLYPGPGHSPDNLVVFFPSNGILFGGCMIKASPSVGFIGDADLDRWKAAVDRVRAMAPRKVVPGHGAVAGPELFDLTANVVREARRATGNSQAQ